MRELGALAARCRERQLLHDSQKLVDLLNKGNTSSDVYADSAYRSAETERKLRAQG